MRRTPVQILSLTILFISGCGASTVHFEYKPSATAVQEDRLSEVGVRVGKGLAQAKDSGSIARYFVIETMIEKGVIPHSPKTKYVDIKFEHGFVDPFLVGRTNLTLVFTDQGELHRIKEVPHLTIETPKPTKN